MKRIFRTRWHPPRWCFKTVLGLRGKQLVAQVRPFFWALPIVFLFFVLHSLDVRRQRKALAKAHGDMK